MVPGRPRWGLVWLVVMMMPVVMTGLCIAMTSGWGETNQRDTQVMIALGLAVGIAGSMATLAGVWLRQSDRRVLCRLKGRELHTRRFRLPVEDMQVLDQGEQSGLLVEGAGQQIMVGRGLSRAALEEIRDRLHEKLG